MSIKPMTPKSLLSTVKCLLLMKEVCIKAKSTRPLASDSNSIIELPRSCSMLQTDVSVTERFHEELGRQFYEV